MKGDFSNWDNSELQKNYHGSLQQQGKVFIDEDFNSQTRIFHERDRITALDSFGKDIVAVPSIKPESFLVKSAAIIEKNVLLSVVPGRVWVNGNLVYLNRDHTYDQVGGTIERRVTLNKWSDSFDGSVQPGKKYAVVLSLWHETLSAFQEDSLMEPALGGIDTTERLIINTAFCLLPLEDNENCPDMAEKFSDELSGKGTLTVEFPQEGDSDPLCPMQFTEGYSGFEHYHYRIEIARTDNFQRKPYFKWSRYNGGLVGNGNIENKTIEISGNLQAIESVASINDGAFYLEIVEYDSLLGHYRVTMGAQCTYDSAQQSLTWTEPMYTDPVAVLYDESGNVVRGKVFFRLWDGVEQINDYTSPEGKILTNSGLVVKLENPVDDNYSPGDYWNFKVYADEMSGHSNFPNRRKPEGIHYHRAPLAILQWPESQSTIEFISKAKWPILDCREIFRPLTDLKLRGCCSFRVGDGIQSQGDVNSIEDALDLLPDTGGEICLLPGTHRTGAKIQNCQNIVIKGCGKETMVVPKENDTEQTESIFTIIDSENITLENMNLVCIDEPPIMLVDTSQANPESETEQAAALREIKILNNRIMACQSAIKVIGGSDIYIVSNQIRMLDREDGKIAIYVKTENCRIEKNEIRVIPAQAAPPEESNIPNEQSNPANICANPFEFYRSRYLQLSFHWFFLFKPDFSFLFEIINEEKWKAPGGIQVGGASNTIKISDNVIEGGSGNGITLGDGSLLSNTTFDEGTIIQEEPSAENLIALATDSNTDIKVICNDSSGKGVANVIMKLYEISGDNFKFIKTVTTDVNGVYTYTNEAQTKKIYGVQLVDSRYSVLKTDYPLRHVVTHVPSNPDAEVVITLALAIQDIETENTYLYDIVVEENLIKAMSLNGIGGSLSADLAKMSKEEFAEFEKVTINNPVNILMKQVIDKVIIRENHILNCATHDFRNDSIYSSGYFNLGGIALSYCKSVVIHDNTIEENGLSHKLPLCGIFVTGNGIEISRNQILNNGPFDKRIVAVTGGLRGGIVVQNLVRSNSRTTMKNALISMENRLKINHNGKVKVANNYVLQPYGMALFINASAVDISVENNSFHSNLNVNQSFGTVQIQQTPGFLPSPRGYILHFINNQTRLELSTNCTTSQNLQSCGDIGFFNNQSIIEKYDDKLETNTVLNAETIRASGNRLLELRKTVPATILI